MAFIFNANAGETPDSIARKREIAEAIAGRAMGRAPRDVGEGLHAIGQALAYRRMMGQIGKSEAAGRESAAGAFSPIIAALGGGQWSGVSSDDLKPDVRAVAPPQANVGRTSNQNVGSTIDFANAGNGDIRQKLLNRGMPEHIADAFVMNFKDESGLDPGISERNPTVPGSRGGYGLYQLTGPRRKAYEAYAAEKGVPLDSADAQLDFMMTELEGPESAAWQAIQAAPDKGSAAAAIVNQFLRPAEAHRASRVARYTGGQQQQPVQVASLDQSIGMPDVHDVPQAGTNPIVEALMKLKSQEMAVPFPANFNFSPGPGATIAPQDVEAMKARAPTDGSPYSGPGATIAPQDMAALQRPIDPLAQFASTGITPPAVHPGVQKPLGVNNPGNIGMRMPDGSVVPAGGDFPPAPPPPSQVAQAAPQNGPSVQQLFEAAQNPWLNDSQRSIINMLLERQLTPKEYNFITGRDGAIFRADPTGGTIDQVYGGKPDKFRVLSNDEELKMGLDPANAYQIGADDKISKIGGEGTTVNIDQKTEGAFDKELAVNDAKTYSTMSTEGMNAKADLGIIGELEALLQGQGGTMTGVQGWLAQKGVDVGEATDDLQATQALINKLVPTQRQPGSGSMSDRDVELFTRSLPSLWNQPGGNQKILNVMRGLAQYKAEQGRISDSVLTGEITRQEARKMLQALPNPLAEFQGKKDGAPDDNIKEGDIIENDAGERMILRNGKWEPM